MGVCLRARSAQNHPNRRSTSAHHIQSHSFGSITSEDFPTNGLEDGGDDDPASGGARTSRGRSRRRSSSSGNFRSRPGDLEKPAAEAEGADRSPPTRQRTRRSQSLSRSRRQSSTHEEQGGPVGSSFRRSTRLLLSRFLPGVRPHQWKTPRAILFMIAMIFPVVALWLVGMTPRSCEALSAAGWAELAQQIG